MLTTRWEWGWDAMTDQEKVDLKERIIGMVQENPRISTRDIAPKTGASGSEV